MARYKKRALWVDTETSHGEDPSASGAGYLWMPCRSIGDLADNRAQLKTNYQTGRNWPTAPIAGPDAWAIECTTPALGMVSAAADGYNASSLGDDWYDQLMLHVFGVQATTAGDAVSASAASTIDTADDTYDSQHLIPVYESGLAPNGADRVQWALVTDDGSAVGGGTQYNVSPAWVSAPSAAAVAYGSKHYRADDDGGNTLSFLMTEDDEAYLLGGGRCIGASATFEAGQIIEIRWQFAGTTKTNFTPTSHDQPRASAPVAGVAPGSNPLVFLGSAFFFDGTRYAIEGGTLDFGITASERKSSETDDGRSDYVGIDLQPMLTVRPLRTEALQTLKRAATGGRVFLQWGAGILAGGVLNTSCWHFENGVIQKADPVNGDGEIRQEVQIKAYDAGEFASGEAGFPVQHVRA